MVNKILIVAKREYLERVRQRSFVIMTLLVPLLMAGAALIPIYVASKSGPSIAVRKIRILDATGAGIGERVAANIRSDSSLADSIAGPFVVALTAAELPKAEEDATKEVMKPKSLSG